MTRGFLTAASLLAFWVLTASVLIFVGLTGNALLSANDRLATVDQALTSVQGNTDPLTGRVHQVNGQLVDIEAALQPLHGQADQLNPILSQVQQTLTQADPAVTSIEAHAAAVEGRLTDADRLAKIIAGNAAQADPKVSIIQHRQLDTLLSLLTPIHADLVSSTNALVSTQTNLAAACHKIDLLALVAAGNTC